MRGLFKALSVKNELYLENKMNLNKDDNNTTEHIFNAPKNLAITLNIKKGELNVFSEYAVIFKHI